MRVYLCGQDWTESHEEMYMDLPATPWELVDALEKLNLVCEGDLYLQAEEYYDFDYIQGFIPESTSLSRLNELCAVLDGMDEQYRIGFRGLLQSSAFFDRFNLGFDRLMDLALAKDCYHIAADVGSDEQLGRFLCQNGFIEGTEELPKKVYELLIFRRSGRTSGWPSAEPTRKAATLPRTETSRIERSLMASRRPSTSLCWM